MVPYTKRLYSLFWELRGFSILTHWRWALNLISSLSLHLPEPFARLRTRAVRRLTSAEVQDQSQLQLDVNKKLMSDAADVVLVTDTVLASSACEMRRWLIWDQSKLAASAKITVDIVCVYGGFMHLVKPVKLLNFKSKSRRERRNRKNSLLISNFGNLAGLQK